MTAVSSGAVAPDALERYLTLVTAGDRDRAIDHVLALLDGGWSLRDIVSEVLAPAQEEVGRRWEGNLLSVAEEHAATAVCDALLAVVATEARRRTPSEIETAHPPTRAVAACVEDEWHVLPLRMLAEELICDGLHVTFLGPSVPPAHLGSYLELTRPDACLLSCTVVSHLPSLRRCIDAAHAAGVPVIAGGRAFAGGRARADAAGADAWATGAAEVASVLDRWSRRRPVLRRPPSQPGDSVHTLVEAALLERPSTEHVNAVMDGLLLRYPDLATYDARQLDLAREDVGHVMRHVAAALVLGDPEVFFDFTEWAIGVLSARGVPPQAVVSGYEALRAIVRAEMPNAGLLIESALTLYQ